MGKLRSVSDGVFCMPNYYIRNKRFAWANEQGLEFLRQTLYPRVMDEKAMKKAEIVNFFEKFGLDATVSAFKVSKTRIYVWRQVLQVNNGRVEALVEQNRRPKRSRVSAIDPLVKKELERLRNKHKGLGKDKLKPLLDSYCNKEGVKTVSISTIGRVVGELILNEKIDSRETLRFQAKTGRLFVKKKPNKKKKLRARDYQILVPGDLLQLDAVVRFKNGIRRYIISAVDCKGRFAFSYGYSTLSSRTAKDFLGKLIHVAPFTIAAIQTDNGSEFHKEFSQALEELGITHFYTYPRCPRMNGKIERYNRTVQEEFIDWHEETLMLTLPEFNQQLIDWLLWYNTERPHYALKQVSPLNYLVNELGFSQMLWTHTNP